MSDWDRKVRLREKCQTEIEKSELERKVRLREKSHIRRKVLPGDKFR